MRVYQVDFELADKEAFVASGEKLPALVLANGFESALAKAKSYESENVKVFELKCTVADKIIAFADGLEGN